MVLVKSGKTPDGNECVFYLDGKLEKNLQVVKHRVIKKNWDYVGIICGLPGSGKSTFARLVAKYLCPWFDASYIAFTDAEFINITNNCPEYSAVVLDESFQSLNTRTSRTPEFLRIISHLQLIRQKHLFILLCLPNFFDLTKGIAIFRSSHLFMTYASAEGDRGRFLAFGRKEKRKLYVDGGKYLDYDCVRSNFRGRFYKGREIINEKEYDRRKLEHLTSQEKKYEKEKVLINKWRTKFCNVIHNLNKAGLSYDKLSYLLKIPPQTLQVSSEKAQNPPEIPKDARLLLSKSG